MLETILRTKPTIPPIRPNLVPRLRLIEQLNQGLHLGHKLTLLSAPAGFGKTTLVSAWVGSFPLDSAQESQISAKIAWMITSSRYITLFISFIQEKIEKW